jgi:glutamate--cysteine ligase
MSNKQEAAGDGAPIESKADLIRLFERGERPKAEWKIGTEHEKFVFRLADHGQPSWAEAGGIRDLLTAFGRFGWEPVLEDGKIIAATGADGSLSLEPAGQFELSGAMLENLHQTCAETGRHRQQCLQPQCRQNAVDMQQFRHLPGIDVFDAFLGFDMVVVQHAGADKHVTERPV